ncbi:MAG: ABC transporter substrate-binding protein, partial [Pseudomonadota bacterium]
KDKKANGFRHFFNSYMSGVALAPILIDAYGNDRKAYHLSMDYNWGWTTEAAMKTSTEALGWETVEAIKTPTTTQDFSSYLAPVLNSGADVLVLNQYGGAMARSLTQAVEFGMAAAQSNGKDFQIVVPLYSRLMAQGAGENAKGIFGSSNWHWSLAQGFTTLNGTEIAPDPASAAFVQSFGQKYGFPPSQAAHTCYVQAILYADACQRAGSFRPSAVGAALEGFSFDGLGNGPTEYRAEDHQCFKDVLVVKGKENPTSKFDVLEVVEVTPRAKVEYDASIFGGELGEFNDGA